MRPKEDPKDRAERERQRRIAALDRRETAEENAAGITTDLRSVYGLRSISAFGMSGKKAPKAPPGPILTPFAKELNKIRPLPKTYEQGGKSKT